MKIEISSWKTQKIIYTCEAESLCEADLHGANLYGANLHGADLCGANLRDADLRGVNLRGADLCNAEFSKTKISFRGKTVEVNFTEVKD